MAPAHKEHRLISELRQDPTTGKWILLATGRAKRSVDLAQHIAPHAPLPSRVERCPFCNFKEYPQEPDTLILPDARNWRVRVFPNKYPALSPQDHVRAWKVGPATVMEGAGFHEVIVPRPHNGSLSTLSSLDAETVIRAWRDRYRTLMVKPSVAYIQIIENHGTIAGASVEHIHAQLFALPVLPPDEVRDLLEGSERYAREHGSCAYCDTIAFEREYAERIVYENDRFIVLSPFSPRTAYEQWVLPKEHAAGFEQLTDADLPLFTDATQAALRGLSRVFNDPPYNLYLNSAPCDTEGYVCPVDAFPHFHWHVRILPRFSTWAGFELATGMEIVETDPNDAAAALRTTHLTEGKRETPSLITQKRRRSPRM